MAITDALTTYLMSQSGLTALIDRRFYFDEDPQSEKLPCVICINISDVKDHIFGGQQVLEHPYYQFTVFASTKAAAQAVAAQLKTALNEYSGTLSGIVVQKIELQNELSTKYISPDGTVKADTINLEYQIWYLNT